MSSRSIRAEELPPGAVLETWGDNTCWLIWDDGRKRLPLREYVQPATEAAFLSTSKCPDCGYEQGHEPGCSMGADVP